MKKYFTLVIFVFVMIAGAAQDNDLLSKQRFSLDFGSYRNRYLYPVTNLKYTTKLYKKYNIVFSARLRSYGTWYLFSKSAYDFTPVAEYYLSQTEKSFYFSAGIGTDVRLRLVNDERSTATSSTEPLVCFAAHGIYKKIRFTTPLWTRFYSNGISYTLLPEVSIQVKQKFSLYLRYEISYLKIYNMTAHEWRRDCFVGAQLNF